MADPVTCAAIILAAGASTRLGQPKQLIRIDGETMLRRATRLAVEAGSSPVIAVLASDEAQLTRELAGLPASIVINGEWQTGMASSLKCGLQAVLATDLNQENVMVLVCDQPTRRIDLERSARHSRHATIEDNGFALLRNARRAGNLFPDDVS